MIKLIKSSFYNEKETKNILVDFILKAEQLSMGENCKKFEEEFIQKQGRKYGVFVANGSLANLVLIQSLKNLGRLKTGDKIAVSSLTWSTNIMPLIQLGFEVEVIDCNLQTLNISPELFKQHLSGIKALFLTNVLGFSDDIVTIKKICDEENILFLEDNCESLGSKVDGKYLGNYGLAATFSFFVGHHLSTIEGGMIVTDNEELYYMLVMVRAHGWDRNLPIDKQKSLRQENGIDDFFSKYTFYDLAINARPTEIQGFLGRAQLNYWDEIVEKRQANFKKFKAVIDNNDDFVSLNFAHMEIISNFSMPLICKNEDIFNKYKKLFEENKIEIRPIIAGNITQQPFYKKYIKKIIECKNSDFIHQYGFYFPNNPELTEAEVDSILSLLKK